MVVLVVSTGATVYSTRQEAAAIDRLTAEVATLNALIGD